MASDLSSPGYDRVIERRRAVALAHHFREAEGLSIAEIAECLGRSPTTIKAHFYDPTGEKARARNRPIEGDQVLPGSLPRGGRSRNHVP
jgi:AraC-like DNA-binding protein